MDVDEFAATVDLPGKRVDEAFELYSAEASAPRKTFAARSADLAFALRRNGFDDSEVFAVVAVLAQERRR